MITRRIFTVASAAALAAGAARAMPSPQEAAEAPALTEIGLEALRRGCEAPALAAAAQRRGGTAKVWATGVRMAGAAPRVMPGDQWHLGSISKSFLATLAGRLVDRGQLAWNDTLGAALAKEHPHLAAPYRDATLLHLMSHRAGLQDNLPLHQMRAFDASAAPERAQRQAFLANAFAMPAVAPLGTKTLYSNLGYVAAAALIEARTGRSWEALMRQEVFVPLGLQSAGFGPPGRKGALTEPVGHGPFFEQPYRPHPVGEPNDDLPLVMGPAGRVHMSLADLTTYLAAHRDRTALLKPGTWDVLHTPHFDGEYALGWNTWPDGSFTHDGSNLLWYAVAGFNPKTGLVAAAAANDGRPSVWNAVGEARRQAMAAV
jgi:CubicO group peptidase (beta-lactamase class C family)